MHRMKPAQIYLTKLPAHTLLLRGFSGEEALSTPFRYLADLSSADPAIDFNQVVGRRACIVLETDGSAPRHFHGIVCRFIQVPGNVGEIRYQAEIVPWLWLLTRTSDCRIYQDKSVIEIVEDVFRRFGFTDYRLRLSRQYYRKREYCVQYRETSFDFVNRLLESEGITYFFEHSRDQHQMILVDSPAGHGQVKGYEVVGWHPAEASSAVPESIRRWIFERQLQPSTYAHTEYDFTKPRADLKAAASFPESLLGREYEIFDYPGEYQDLDDGETYANLRAEELGASQDTYLGESDARGLAAGFSFQLKDHPRDDQNQSYLITGIRLRFDQSSYVTGGRGEEPFYQCDFSCLPANRPFRPRRITRKPVIRGEQTAVVVGAAGKEIGVDDYARVKVHFFWDRHNPKDESASCWLRVSQPWAGKGYGGMNIPRVGVEVIVGFLEGDPDRPIITGRVYNKATMPHASNAGRDGKPGNAKPSGIRQAAVMTSFKSESTPGGGGSNEITMNDTAGAEGLFIKAQKDETHIVGNDREDTVTNNETRKVVNNRERVVGNNETVKVGVNRSVTVGANHTENIIANQSITVGANKTENITIACSESIGAVKSLSIGAAYQVSVGGLMNETVGAMKSVEVALSSSETVGETSSLKAKKITLTAEDEIAIKVGGALITMKKNGDITIKGKNIKIKGTKIEQN